MIKRLKRWNKWRRYNKQDNALQKLFVLLGIRESVTFALTLTDEEVELYGSTRYKELCAGMYELAYAAELARHKFEDLEKVISDFQEVIRNDGLEDLEG